MGDLRVLIVEGHDRVRRELAASLGREHGIEIVGAAATGQEAVQQVMSSGPDLVLLDVRIDDEKGVETCRRIAAIAPTARIAVLTSYADEAERSAFLSAGASACLPKVIGTRQLAHVIRDLAMACGQRPGRRGRR